MPALLSIADLIADPALDTQVLAGAGGLERTVRWAQTSESAEPWRWLGDEELLMTLGLNLPAEPAGQVDFVFRAAGAGIAGMTVGQDGLAPELSPQMLAEADRLDFPLLSTGPMTPFVVIARTVAAVTTNELNRGVLILSRLYQEAGSQAKLEKRRGRWVEKLCGVEVAVQDTATGCLVIGDKVPEVPRRHSLPTLRPTQLLLPAQAQLDSLVLVHLKQILTVDANALLQEAVSESTSAEAKLRLAFDGQLGEKDLMDGRWLSAGESFRVACAAESALGLLSMTLALTGLPPLALSRKQQALAVVRDRDAAVLESLAHGTGTHLGLSAPQHRFADLAGAAEEARNALQDATDSHPVAEYSGAQVSLLARSASEAEQIVASVLGDLGAGAASVGTYRGSLFALLDDDLQWQKTASRLGIHRQTLAYRIRQAETLCGRSVRKVADLAELYLARKAWEQLDMDQRT
ncbi:PucR family transcriptional regulator [Glutamicibacter sp. TV12E]|uniref:PucR family transcriptional regulator n=1 Tax=Glutamicibacter sp. TV12E TaxID=3446362 RepID=UPI0040347389